jgi:hypothetical protein
MRPDMPALLRRLVRRGLKLGIVANQPAQRPSVSSARASPISSLTLA